MTKKKSGIQGSVAFIIVLAVAVICAAGGFFFVSNAKKGFAKEEATMPESAISTYLKQVKNKDYSGMYENSMIISPSLNSQDAYIAKIEEIYQGVNTDKVTFSPVYGVSDTQYNLYQDGNFLSTVKLVQSSDGTWLAATLFTGKNNYTVEVPTGLTLQCNGMDVDDSYKTDTAVPASNFMDMYDTSSAPLVDRYQLNNLLSEPTITVAGQDGYTTIKDVLSNTLFVGKSVNDPELASTFTDDALLLAGYPAQESGMGAVTSIAVTGTGWYQRYSTMQNTWFTAHGTSSFTNVTATNLVAQSEDSCVGYVTFDYYADNGEVNRTWYGGYQITLLKVNGSWKIAGLAIDNDLNPNKQ